ncbi:hypothetical protein [Streptomyces sp.]|uniref:hypothetical protein n=1 Tax=Streptomyces sp. TaxID=1931 RepID=UPI0028122081|nr:hypothetical protein [Streptomyces sp.]
MTDDHERTARTGGRKRPARNGHRATRHPATGRRRTEPDGPPGADDTPGGGAA